MAFDSITNSTPNTKDFAKKKKVNRSAKLKQCKLDARRHQWLSQVNNQEKKDEVDVGGGVRRSPAHGCNERDPTIKILEMNNGENDGSVQHYSDSDSSSHSLVSHSRSVVGSHCSGTSFTGSGSSSRSSSSSGRSISGNMSEEDDDGCVDDWEALADAMAATDAEQKQNKPCQELPLEHESVEKLICPPELPNSQPLDVDISMPKEENRKAWRPDDASRPPSLPTLFKQHSFPIKMDKHAGSGGLAWASADGISTQSSCPICCEDLDFTDSSFLPCYCGFRLCLFCHKRILEEDGRCPGCRKQYEHDGVTSQGNGNFVEGCSPFRLARSFSMITRS